MIPLQKGCSPPLWGFGYHVLLTGHWGWGGNWSHHWWQVKCVCWREPGGRSPWWPIPLVPEPMQHPGQHDRHIATQPVGWWSILRKQSEDSWRQLPPTDYTKKPICYHGGKPILHCLQNIVITLAETNSQTLVWKCLSCCIFKIGAANLPQLFRFWKVSKQCPHPFQQFLTLGIFPIRSHQSRVIWTS